MIIFLTIFLNLFYHLKGEVISINVTNAFHDRPSIIAQFPNESQTKHMFLNTYLPFSVFWFNSSQIKTERITKNNQALYLESTYPSVIYQTDIILNNNTKIDNLFAYNIFYENSIFFKDVGLALGFNMKDESFSIVHQLYNKKTIERLQFAFHNIGKDGHFYIGGVPNEAHLSLPYKGIIKEGDGLPTWGFTIKTLFISNIEYNVSIPAIISTASDCLVISDYLYDLFAKTILLEYINNKICQEKNDYDYNYITCNRTAAHFGNKTAMIIDNIKVEFDTNAIITNRYGIVSSYRNKERKVHNFTGAVLGPQFLSLFNYTVFDYEKRQIEFYSDRTNITSLIVQMDNFVKIKVLLCIDSVIVIANLILLIYVYCKL